MRVILAGTIIATFVAAIFSLRPKLVGDLDNLACDAVTRWAGGGKSSGQVAIVEVDDPSLAELGRWPWPRDLVGSVVQRILDSGAAAVALDILFDTSDRTAPSKTQQPSDSSAKKDSVLAGVLSGRPVIVGYAFRFDGASSNSEGCHLPELRAAVTSSGGPAENAFFRPSGVLCNAPEISQAAANAGFMNAAVEGDGRLRTIPVAMEYQGRLYPSLALAAFEAYNKGLQMQARLDVGESPSLRIGSQVIPLEGRSSMRLRFRGPRRTFPYISAARLMNNTDPALSQELRGKIVILGGSALGLPYPVATPVDPQFPDAEVQATAIDNLLTADPFHRPESGHLLEALLAMLAGMSATFLFARGRARQSALIVVAGVAGMWVGSALLVSTTRLLFSPLPVTFSLVISFPAIILLNYKREKRRAEQTEGQLALEREAAQSALFESERRYRRLVENVNDAIVVADGAGHLAFANRRFQQWFGLEGTDIRQTLFEDYVAPEWRAPFREWQEALADGAIKPDRFEYQGIRADGSRIWIEALSTEVLEDERIAGRQWALRDISARKMIEERYLQAQKLEIVGRLAGGIAHDFNNLLQIINGYADLLIRGQDNEIGHVESLKEIRGAGERAAELTRKLLTFSRKEAVQPQILDLNEVVSEAVKMCSRLIGEDIELTTSLGSALGGVVADAGQIHQIVMNLLLNARDAMPRGGEILVETKGVDPDEHFPQKHPAFPAVSWIYLGVSDNGAGMSAEVLSHLFEPFFTTKEPGKGTGLGLATVYGIMEQSSGKIEVSSTLGEGTIFHLYFPRAAGAPPQRSVAVDVPVVGSAGGTILLVEDQDGVRQFLRTVLERRGYRLIEAANGAEAIAFAAGFTGTIDLLLTDLIMPIMNGQELAELVIKMRPSTKVLFMSGHAKENIGGRGIDMADLVYLQKPFSPDQLLKKVRGLLETTRSAGGVN